MAEISLQSIGIAVVVVVFFGIFASGIITKTVQQYDITVDPDVPNLTAYEGMEDDIEQYQFDAENKTGDITGSSGDSEGVKSTISAIKRLITIRDTVGDIKEENVNIFNRFLPVQFWIMVGSVIGLVFVFIIAVVLWRWKEKLG